MKKYVYAVALATAMLSPVSAGAADDPNSNFMKMLRGELGPSEDEVYGTNLNTTFESTDHVMKVVRINDKKDEMSGVTTRSLTGFQPGSSTDDFNVEVHMVCNKQSPYMMLITRKGNDSSELNIDFDQHGYQRSIEFLGASLADPKKHLYVQGVKRFGDGKAIDLYFEVAGYNNVVKVSLKNLFKPSEFDKAKWSTLRIKVPFKENLNYVLRIKNDETITKFLRECAASLPAPKQ